MSGRRHSPRRRRAPRDEQHTIRGFSLIELLVICAVLAIIAGIAIPAVLQARMRATESAAIASLHVIRLAETSYSTSCGLGGFAQSLQYLAKVPIGATDGFVSEPLDANGVIQSGYVANVTADAGASVVTPAAKTCNASAAPAVSGYFAERHPDSVGLTGQRSFATATRGAIYVRDDGVPITPGMAGAYTLR